MAVENQEAMHLSPVDAAAAILQKRRRVAFMGRVVYLQQPEHDMVMDDFPLLTSRYSFAYGHLAQLRPRASRNNEWAIFQKRPSQERNEHIYADFVTSAGLFK